MGFSRFFRRSAWDEERAREIDAYVEEETADNIARGMSPDDARFAAQRKFGNSLAVREQIYDMNTLGWLESIWQDLRHGARLLRRNPGFATVAILSLALGIGANTAIFQLLNAVRLKSLPVQKPQELALVEITDMSAARGNFYTWNNSLTNPIWENLRDRQQVFSGMLAWSPTDFNLATSGDYRGAQGLMVSGEFFHVLGVQAARGRLFTAADDVRGCANPGAVISYSFWQREFGGDPGVIGRKLTLDYQPAEIIGVTPVRFEGLDVGHTFDVAVPLCAEAIGSENSRLDQKHSWWLNVMGRLKPGVTLQQATAQLTTISPAIMDVTVPTSWDAASIQSYRAFKLAANPAATGISQLRHTYEDPLILLLALAGLVLLIACANLANLLLARSSVRTREIAVRLAIGASRGRLVRQLFSESLLLAVFGATAGVLLARWLSRTLVWLLATDSNGPVLDLGADWRVLAFTALLATLTAIVFGLAPAFTGTRTSPMSMMNAGGRTSTATRERFLLSRGLVVSQIALSLVLLFGCLLFVRSLTNVLIVNPGLQKDGVLVGFSSWNRVEVPVAQRVEFQRRMLDRIRTVPGVSGVTAAAIIPLTGSGWNNHMWMDGQAQRTDNAAVSWVNRVSPRFFATMRMTLLSGRDFDERDSTSAPKVAIVNETFVRKFVGSPDAIGKRFRVESTPSSPETLFQIVGVVSDSNYRDLREKEREPIVFISALQDAKPSRFTALLVRTSMPPANVLPSLRHALAEISPEIVTNWDTLDAMVRRGTLQERLLAELSTFFGLLAGLLAIVGLYGVLSYIVARRTNEIGVRMALGADRASVVRLILREAVMLLLAGVVVGTVLSLFAGRAASTMLFGLRPNDPITLAAAVLGLGVVSIAASYLPARRAANLDPVAALRAE
jgi:predicted permease